MSFLASFAVLVLTQTAHMREQHQGLLQTQKRLAALLLLRDLQL
jgi:hypothetical protein